MNLLDWLKDSATAIGAFVVLFGLLALVMYFVGVDNPAAVALLIVGYVFLAAFVIFGVWFGVEIGCHLWGSKIKWKMAIGAIFLACSTTLGIATAIYVYGNIDTSDCPSGVSLRYC